MRRVLAGLVVAVLAGGCGSDATGPNATFAVKEVTPGAGSTNGATAVIIAGTGFASGATVTFAGTAATNIVVVSSTEITATAPAHAAGTVDIAVKNPDGHTGSITGGFLYSNLSGTWSGTTSQGKSISFVVNSANIVTAIDYGYVITGSAPCTANGLAVDETGELDVSSMKFSVSSGGHSVSGTFSSATSVSGTFSDSTGTGCVGSVTGTWTATKG